MSDQQLLRDYADSRSESAFAELVRRHIDFVYSAALRMVRDAQLAEDVTQSVFLALAENSRQLVKHPVLPGWLHRTTQNLSANSVRSDMRRRAREQEVATMNELLSSEPDTTWEQIAPQLDAAIGVLSDADRHAVLLRYFQRKSAREIAEILSLSDDAAQKRVSRAVEKLREYFSKNGIAIGSGGFVPLLSANAVQSAPLALSATISSALVGATVKTTGTIAAGKILIMTTAQKTLMVLLMVAAAGMGIYETRQASTLRTKVQSLEKQQSTPGNQIQQLIRERDEAKKQLADLQNDVERLNHNSAELIKLRGEVTRLRGDANQTNDPTQVAAKAWVNRVGQLKERLKKHPDSGIPEIELLDDEDWLAAVKDRDLDSENGYRRALSTLRGAAESKFASLAFSALQKFREKNSNKFPSDISQLTEFFDPPVDDAILQRWQTAPKKTVPNIGVGEWIITEKAAVDDVLDLRIAIGEYGSGSSDFLSSVTQEILKPVYKAYGAENKGRIETDDYYARLSAYATTPEQKSAIQKLIEREALRK